MLKILIIEWKDDFTPTYIEYFGKFLKKYDNEVRDYTEREYFYSDGITEKIICQLFHSSERV